MITNKLLGAGGVGGLNIADLFNTTIYAGDGTATKVITTGIDLSANEGMVWFYSSSFAQSSITANTVTGATKYLDVSNTTQLITSATSVKSFDAAGVTIGSNNVVNRSATNFALWSFASAEGFFDVLEYTGTGAAQNIAHNLNMVPGAILVKTQSGSGAPDDWKLYHRSLNGGVAPEDYYIAMANSEASESTNTAAWNSTAPTDSVFSVGATTQTNSLSDTYTAYLFGHDTSGSGLIQCGAYAGNGSNTGPVVTLGWEPQWLLIKSITVGKWGLVYDNVRSPVNPRSATASPFEPSIELSRPVDFTSTGFQPKDINPDINSSGNKYAYIAIRKAD